MKKIFLLAISSYCFIVGQTLDINSLRMAQLKQGVNDINPNGVSTVKQSEAKILIDKPIDERLNMK